MSQVQQKVVQREALERRRELYVSALQHRLERIAKIHSPKVADVKIVDQIGAPPGWSAEGHIRLNRAGLPDPMTIDGLAVWIAVLMHEVGHCQWSPEAVVWPAHLRKVANLAEDQREEHLVAAVLPGVINEFRLAVATLILNQTQTNQTIKDVGVDLATIWALVAGRLYLSKKVRKAARDAAIAEKGADWTSQVADLIARYKRLTDPGFSDQAEAVVVLEELANLLGGEQVQIVDLGCRTDGTGTPDVGGVPIDGMEHDDLDDDEEESESGGAGEGESQEEGSGGDGTFDGEADGEGESQEDSEGGRGTGRSTRTDREKIKDAAKDEKEESTDKMRKQAKIVMRQVREDIGVAEPDMMGADSYPPSPLARKVKARLEQALKPLVEQADAGLEQMTHNGRIRPERLAAGYRPDLVFDKWRLDQHDSVAAEIVVAVDVSGSMGSHMTQLSEAIWVMRQVVDKTASRITVLLWDDIVSEYRYPLTNQVPQLRSRGGTDVTPVARLAKEIFAESRARRRWLLVMTDGYSAHDDKNMVKALFHDIEKMHVAVTALEYGAHASTKDWGVSDRKKINNLGQMPELLGAMLKNVYRKIV